jgi:STE24 endopeptidase
VTHLTRRIQYSFAAVACVLAAVGAVAQSGAPPAAANLVREVADILLPPPQPDVVAYNRALYALYFVRNLWNLAGLWLLVAWGLGPALLQAMAARVKWEPAKVMACWVAVVLATAAWALPWRLMGYQMERAYGFATLGPGLWLADRARDALLACLYAPLAALAYHWMKRRRGDWWLPMSAVTGVGVLVMAVLWPVAVDPLYNRYRPLEQGALRAGIERMAEKAGAPDPEVLVMDSGSRTTKLNAYVTGIGPTKRIVIWDTTLAKLPPEQVLAIVGHELAHYSLNHVWVGCVLGILGAILIFRLLSLALPRITRATFRVHGIRASWDPAGLPLALLLLNVVLFLQSPIGSAVSRTFERQADARGLTISENGISAARAYAAFYRHDFADPDPPPAVVWWFYSHPPLRERVERALWYGLAVSPAAGRNRPKEGPAAPFTLPEAR